MSKGRILVVDDDSQIRRVMRATLVAEGYEVSDARNGHDALDRIRSAKYDLVLLDINMPGIPGIEACRSIRLISEVSIIMMTVRHAEGMVGFLFLGSRLRFFATAIAATPSTLSLAGALLRTSARPLLVFREKAFYASGDFLFQLGVEIPARRARKTDVNAFDEAVATDEDRRGPRVEVPQLWYFLIDLIGITADEHRIFDSVVLDEPAQPHQILQLFLLLKIQRDDLKALAPVLPIQLREKWGFVVAIGAPTAGDIDQHYFSAEAGVGTGYDVPIDVGKTERKWFVGITDLHMPSGIGGLGQAFGASIGRPVGH
jgi:CheY-like chemotaxis protein